jgi:hypothetical protein
MPTSQRFPYTALKNTLDEIIFRPLLTVEMTNGEHAISATGLLDSGADVNVLPYGLGIALGLLWDEQHNEIRLSGNLARYEARGVLLSGRVGAFPPTHLGFAWTRAEQAPLIFGHTNFFEVFNICFYRTEAYFTVTQKDTR